MAQPALPPFPSNEASRSFLGTTALLSETKHSGPATVELNAMQEHHGQLDDTVDAMPYTRVLGPDFERHCTELAWSDDDNYLATSSQDGSIRVYLCKENGVTLRDPRLLCSFKAHANAIRHLLFWDHGSFLLSCSSDGGFAMWKTHDGALVQNIYSTCRCSPLVVKVESV